MVVAIDGPAGSGKSAVSKYLADKLGYFLLNSGFFYRAITYKALQTGVDIHNEDAVLSLASQFQFKVDDDAFYLNNENVLPFLHTDEVSANVATVSSYAKLRSFLNTKMATLAQEKNLICEGRDMTTVVFPNAEVKIYLDASVQERAKRRFKQGFSTLSLAEIEQAITERDEIDKNKAVGALVIAKNACYIDSSNLTLNEICVRIEEMIRRIEGLGK